MEYELDDIDLELVSKLREAMPSIKEGDPMRDFLEVEDLLQTIELLLTILDAEK